MESPLSVEECRARLALTTVPTLNLRRLDPFAKEMLTGTVSSTGGRVRSKLKGFYFVSGRDLYFELRPQGDGAELIGRVDLSLALRLYGTLYIVSSVLLFVWFLVAELRLSSDAHAFLAGGALFRLSEGFVFNLLLLWAFSWTCVWLGRSDERAILTLVHRVLQSPETKPAGYRKLRVFSFPVLS